MTCFGQWNIMDLTYPRLESCLCDWTHSLVLWVWVTTTRSLALARINKMTDPQVLTHSSCQECLRCIIHVHKAVCLVTTLSTEAPECPELLQ